MAGGTVHSSQDSAVVFSIDQHDVTVFTKGKPCKLTDKTLEEKEMKHYLSLVLGLMAAVLAAGCASDVADGVKGPDVWKDLVDVTISISQAPSAAATRTTLSDKGDKIERLWKQDDKLSGYDLTQGTPAIGLRLQTLQEGADWHYATLFAYGTPWADNDEIVAIYPRPGIVPTTTVEGTTVTYNLTGQDGTLPTLQQTHDFLWGKGLLKITDAETRTGRGTIDNMITQEMILKVVLNDADGNAITDASHLSISDVSTTATLDLNTGILTPSQEKGTLEIDLKGDGTSNVYYIALFPGDIHPTVTVKRGNLGYVATLRQKTYEKGLYYDTELKMRKTFMEIGGVKWGLGNLMYINGKWGVAPEQWQFLNYKDVYTAGVLKDPKTNGEFREPDGMRDHFNWGVLGDHALEWGHDNYANMTAGDISGKMYEDRACTQPTTDFTKAQYGDVAYWGTQGKYRMPTVDEMKALTMTGYKFGYYRTKNDYYVYGYLFDGRKIEDSDEAGNEITQAEYDNGVFLPTCGVRNEKYGNLKFNNAEAYYMSSTAVDDPADKYRDPGMRYYGITLDKDGVDWGHFQYANKTNGMSLRPVLVE